MGLIICPGIGAQEPARRGCIGRAGREDAQLGAQEVGPGPRRDTALQQEGTALVDDAGALANEFKISLATLPPSSRQRRLALAAVALLLVAFGVTAPFADIQLLRVDAFIPTLGATIFVTDLITSILLFAHFSIIPSRALLALASGYLFTALIVVPHALTFPGAFAPAGLLGAGVQSTAWLYTFWHMGFPFALVVYAWLKDERRSNVEPKSTLRAIGWSVAIVIGLVCVLVWLATAGDNGLPRLIDGNRFTPLSSYVLLFVLSISALALALMWIRGRSVLDQWLVVVACALITELVLGVFFSSARFSLGFYAGRIFALATSTVVLAVLLAETTRLYARLARSIIMLRRERDSKLMNMEAMAASIAHEVRQPLGAISMNGHAALRFLGRATPDLEEARSALNRIVGDSHRANEVLESVRALFRSANLETRPIDVNEVVLEALHVLRGELKDHGVTTCTELTSESPPVMGHKGQLQEVMLNLVHNAVEAMGATPARNRVLRVRTVRHAPDAVAVSVEDSGPGIDPKKIDGIFDAFVTTKPTGMGLGLAICRMIIERHSGQLSASSAIKNGALFQFILPVGTKPPPSFRDGRDQMAT
jgi:signal transduction histidine kinase